ncbi:putative amino acid permease 7 isoform X1 [Senna tora]|uniref:Putative amino acid permease 7 isoform X1 n=1 Tax=Senna tora TaxID=362788 RepID=A0A834WS91_9FABA|nr:putative amino acid permease 7 isoform X1 [Senna tora]
MWEFCCVGNTWSAVAHIITGVIGAGVLSLAWSVAQLGWIAGPLFIIIFAIITIISAFLLSDSYRFPHPVHGITRNPSYMDAVKVFLGRSALSTMGNRLNGSSARPTLIVKRLCFALLLVQMGAQYETWAIRKSNCYHKEGHDAPCEYGISLYMVLFGFVEIFMSFIPNFHNMAWVSLVAAIMSFTYSFIGLGLGIAKVIENGRIMGSITGVPASNIADKLWLVFQALGDIAFAYPYSIILLEIQDTLKSPPPENQTMKKASVISVFVTTFFYLCCGCFGYAAFGNDTPGNLLTGFGFYEPYWLVDFANACIVVHLVGGYQIYSQPIYCGADKWCMRRFPNSVFMNKSFKVKLPLLPAFHFNLFRLCFRSVYVISTTILAILFPYFNQVLGVLGALNFWPLIVYFPVEMYFVQKQVQAWTTQWILFRAFSFFCFFISLVGLIGSLEGIVSEKLS